MDTTEKTARMAAITLAGIAGIALIMLFGPRAWEFFSDGEAVQAWIARQGAAAPLAMVGVVCA